MEFKFKWLEFTTVNEQVRLAKIGDRTVPSQYGIVDISLEGGDISDEFKSSSFEETKKLKYISHKEEPNYLEVVQATDNVEVKTVFTCYDDSSAIRVFTEVKNISGKDLVLDAVSAFNMYGYGNRETDELFFTRFHNIRYAECQPRRNSFAQLGLFPIGDFAPDSSKKICHANIGPISCRNEIPQGIIENATTGQFFMFQLESSNLWYYEISEYDKNYYLHLGGANFGACRWKKALTVGATYKTINVAVALGNSDENVIGEMTKYRRHIMAKNKPDEDLPVAFNEYMHLAWDFPWEENTRKYAPVAAEVGTDYYVIDCGWHKQSTCDTYEITNFHGAWKESLIRFPSSLKGMSEYFASLGMKMGLWLSQELIGAKCEHIIEMLGEECFVQRNGQKVKKGTTYPFYSLDYRQPKVREYMTEVVRRMIEDYGASYIKYDGSSGNNNSSDVGGLTYTDNMEEIGRAFSAWREEMATRFPDVIFEGCCGGGWRMDHEWLSQSCSFSTSDQSDYLRFPYIIGNITSAVLPEQAGVWSMPVVVDSNKRIKATKEWAETGLDDEKIIINMVNSLLGRVHLATDLTLLDDAKKALVKEAIDLGKEMVEDKKKSVPKYPIGFNRTTDDWVVSGIETDEKLYLAVWNLGGELHREIPLIGYKNAKCAYPKANTLEYKLENDTFTVDFTEAYQARFFTFDK